MSAAKETIPKWEADAYKKEAAQRVEAILKRQKEEVQDSTPGPWHIVGDTIYRDYKDGRMSLAFIRFVGTGITEANALLISSAPDLLEGLMALRRVLHKYNHPLPEDAPDIVGLIEKATGKPYLD